MQYADISSLLVRSWRVGWSVLIIHPPTSATRCKSVHFSLYMLRLKCGIWHTNFVFNSVNFRRFFHSRCVWSLYYLTCRNSLLKSKYLHMFYTNFNSNLWKASCIFTIHERRRKVIGTQKSWHQFSILKSNQLRAPTVFNNSSNLELAIVRSSNFRSTEMMLQPLHRLQRRGSWPRRPVTNWQAGSRQIGRSLLGLNAVGQHCDQPTRILPDLPPLHIVRLPSQYSNLKRENRQ